MDLINEYGHQVPMFGCYVRYGHIFLTSLRWQGKHKSLVDKYLTRHERCSDHLDATGQSTNDQPAATDANQQPDNKSAITGSNQNHSGGGGGDSGNQPAPQPTQLFTNMTTSSSQPENGKNGPNVTQSHEQQHAAFPLPQGIHIFWPFHAEKSTRGCDKKIRTSMVLDQITRRRV